MGRGKRREDKMLPPTPPPPPPGFPNHFLKAMWSRKHCQMVKMLNKTNTMLAICEWTISSMSEADSVEGFLESPNAYLVRTNTFIVSKKFPAQRHSTTTYINKKNKKQNIVTHVYG